jgi:hypothetical protein
MRLVSHPNVVDLKAFFYTNGDKASSFVINMNLADQTERRGLLEFSVGVCPRDCLSSIKALLETQASHAHASSEALHVPSGSFAC